MSDEKVTKSEQEWQESLSPEQYHVLREKGTERAFTGEYAHSKQPGEYHCAGCGKLLFRSDEKFESGSGWPSSLRSARCRSHRPSRSSSSITVAHC